MISAAFDYPIIAHEIFAALMGEQGICDGIPPVFGGLQRLLLRFQPFGEGIYYFNNERPVRKLKGKPPVLYRTELVA